MLRKLLGLFMIFSLVILPVCAEDNGLYLNFNRNAQSELQQITTYYETAAELTRTYDGQGVCLTNSQGDAVGRLLFEKVQTSGVTIAQTIRVQDAQEAKIQIVFDGKNLIAVSFSGNQIKALGKNGWVRLRAFNQREWYHVEIQMDLSAKTYQVLIDDIKLGGTIPYEASDMPDGVQYFCSGDGAELLLDDIYISAVKKTATASGGASSAEEDSRNAYYRTYKPRYDFYKAPMENIVEREVLTGALSESSHADGFPVENIIDGKNETKWQAAPALQPANYGKSLILSKESACDGMQRALFEFAPVKGTLILEQDILVTEVTSQKAMPYFFNPSDGYATTMLVNGGNITVAGTSLAYRDISADTWYHIRIEMRTHTQSADIYINGELWAKDVPLRDKCEEISKFQYHMSGQTLGDLCVDNIKLSYFSPLNSFENVILEEDFESYAEGAEALPGWQISHSTGGKVSVKSFGQLPEYKFTQYVNLDVGRETEFEGAYLEIPEGISLKYTVATSRKGGLYNTALERLDKFYSGTQEVYFSPVRAQQLRIIIYDAIDAMGNPAHAQLSELRILRRHRVPVENVAFYANVTVSGEANVGLDKRGVTDNIVAEFGRIGDWQSGNEDEKWAELSWSEPQTVDQIVLHDSASLTDHTKAGILTFDDGTSIEVTDIANSGYPKTIDFEAKTIQKVRFTITDSSGGAGLSEFQVYKVGEKNKITEYVEPDLVVSMNPDYYSRWIAINDVDNDGEAEYLSARAEYQPQSENHWCASICTQEADGTILWTYGDPSKGTHALGSDLPMQVHDINNDGNLEVILCDPANLLILDAKTGKELKKYPLPTSSRYPKSTANDTIILADISGKGYASDIMVKTRYTDVWAFTSEWEPIWYTCMPEGMKVGHMPQPIDIDNDGKDEVIVGYSCIDDDGSIMWSMKKEQYPGFLESGHKDSLEIVRFVLVGDTTGEHIINQKDLALLEKHLAGEMTLTGDAFLSGDTDGDGKITEEDKKLLAARLAGDRTPFPNKGIPREEQRFIMTPCGGGSNIIMFDGNGNRVWSLDDATHYETVEKANLGLSDDPFQVVINNTLDLSGGKAAYEIIDLKGNIVGSRYSFERNRQLNTINWLGDGELDFVLFPSDNMVVDGYYNVRVKPLMPYRAYDTMGMKSVQTGDKNYTCDMDGDGTTDIVLLVHESPGIKLYIYYNKNGAKVADGIGRGYNISQY